MKSMVATALCEADCAARGRHEPTCEDDECGGCLRRQAADGLRVCELHAERIEEDALEAPALHYDLGLVLMRRGTSGERTSGSSSGAPIPDEATMEARIAIRALLVRLTRLIVAGRGVRAPLVQRCGVTFVDTSTATLGPFVARHALWLAAHEQAGDHSRALHTVTRGRVRRLAYPSGSDRLYIGECPVLVTERDGREIVCGTRLYQRHDQPLVTCLGCGTSDTIEQWQKWLIGEAESVSDAYAIAAHLALLWVRPVDPSTIRQWAHRGHVRPLMRPDPTPSDPERETAVRDVRGRTLYRISEVLEYAKAAWGRPYNACLT